MDLLTLKSDRDDISFYEIVEMLFLHLQTECFLRKELLTMNEKDEQLPDQQKNTSPEEKKPEHSKHATPPPTQHAGMSTDPEAMKDKGYVQRISEKTSKH